MWFVFPRVECERLFNFEYKLISIFLRAANSSLSLPDGKKVENYK